MKKKIIFLIKSNFFLDSFIFVYFLIIIKMCKLRFLLINTIRTRYEVKIRGEYNKI